MPIDIAQIIRRKRDGETLEPETLTRMVGAIVDGTASEGQVAAFAMAVFWRGMGEGECAAFTRSMARSGETLDWAARTATTGGPDFDGPVLDKHSTGGIGDKVSLVLAPILAACGARVPMLSGRGLGHTGGTLDKLEAIPGYCVEVAPERLRRVVREAGCAIVGASERLAPADRRLYAIRDVTATVESIPLITASILSKKLAGGVSALVMDVKTGSGAFAAGLDDARALARSLVDVAAAAGLPTRALVTDMDQVLGRTAGNALEVEEAIPVLATGRGNARLLAVIDALAAEALLLGGLADDETQAREQAGSALASGRAAERFAAMVHGLGGPHDLLERPGTHLERAPVVRDVAPARVGVVASVDVRALGLAIIGLGGGRSRPGQRIDRRTGLSAVAGIGEPVGPQRPIARVHAADAAQAERAAQALAAAVGVTTEAMPARGPVLERVIAGETAGALTAASPRGDTPRS